MRSRSFLEKLVISIHFNSSVCMSSACWGRAEQLWPGDFSPEEDVKDHRCHHKVLMISHKLESTPKHMQTWIWKAVTNSARPKQHKRYAPHFKALALSHITAALLTGLLFWLLVTLSTCLISPWVQANMMNVIAPQCMFKAIQQNVVHQSSWLHSAYLIHLCHSSVENP